MQNDMDALTGLPRYPGFAAFWEEAVRAADSRGLPVSLGLADIDSFGKLNADYGTATGDAVLRRAANRLTEIFAEPARVFRYGGDAFSIVLGGVEKEQAFMLLESARQDFSEVCVVTVGARPVELRLSLSAGVATFPDDGSAAQDVVRKANEAMYRAKDSGRNRVCLAREEKMITKTSHYTQGQLQGLSRLAKRMGVGEAVLLREALDDLLRKHNA